MAGRIMEAGILKATAAVLGGEIGLQRFMAQFVTPQEATGSSTVMLRLKNSFPTMPENDRETLATLLSSKTETLLGNGRNLAGFGFDSTFDAEVAFAASSDPVTSAVKVSRDNLLKSLERENQ